MNSGSISFKSDFTDSYISLYVSALASLDDSKIPIGKDILRIFSSKFISSFM